MTTTDAQNTWRLLYDTPPPLPPWANSAASELWPFLPFRILALTLHLEARGEIPSGQQAVAEVVRNRVCRGAYALVKWFPTTIHEVCLQPHQISAFWADWPECRERAMRFLNQGEDVYSTADFIRPVFMFNSNITLGADHYFNPKKVKPKWAEKMVRTVRIGNHDFYDSTL